MKVIIANSHLLLYHYNMKKAILIYLFVLCGCTFPFAFEYVSEPVELPSLSASGGYETMDISIPADAGIPFDDIDFKEVLIRIEGTNNSEVDSDAELVLVSGAEKEILFKNVIPAKGNASSNTVSFLLAKGLNKRQLKFTIQARNDQGNIDWTAYRDNEDFKAILVKYGLTSIEDLKNNPEAQKEALSLIDLKIKVKVSMIFKGMYKLNISNLIGQR